MTKKFFAVTTGFLMSLALNQQAIGADFSFSRTYDNGGELLGEFTADDANSDGVISALEVDKFGGNVYYVDPITQEFFLVDAINKDEPIAVDEFNYVIGTNDLEFVIRTTGRGTPEPGFPLDSTWFVNFSNQVDEFLITDFIISVEDTVGTSEVSVTPQSVPESNNFIALVVFGLGTIINRFCRK